MNDTDFRVPMHSRTGLIFVLAGMLVATGGVAYATANWLGHDDAPIGYAERAERPTALSSAATTAPASVENAAYRIPAESTRPGASSQPVSAIAPKPAGLRAGDHRYASTAGVAYQSRRGRRLVASNRRRGR